MARRRIKKAKAKRDPLANDSIPRATLGRELQRRIDAFGLSRNDAGAIVDDAPSQMSRLMTGHFDEFSADRLVKMLLRLGTEVEVVLRHGPSLRNRKKAKITVKRARG
jgi:predicted XRE-type DNA-binding protein